MPTNYPNPFMQEDVDKILEENTKRIIEISKEIDKIYGECLVLYDDVTNIVNDCQHIAKEAGLDVKKAKEILSRNIK